MLKLNLGSGSTKIPGYVNIDAASVVKPDLVLDFTKLGLPYKVESVDEILMFHCIEHIDKKKHRKVLLECSRVLKFGGMLYVTYPDFWECALRWKHNEAGLRNFWEATLYGRQLYPGDNHVCAMDSDELALLLFECGFGSIRSIKEPDETYYTITAATKEKLPVQSYENLVAQDIRSMRLNKQCL